MSANRLNSDNYLNKCRKSSAKIQEAQLDLGFKSGMLNYYKLDMNKNKLQESLTLT